MKQEEIEVEILSPEDNTKPRRGQTRKPKGMVKKKAKADNPCEGMERDLAKLRARNSNLEFQIKRNQNSLKEVRKNIRTLEKAIAVIKGDE